MSIPNLVEYISEFIRTTINKHNNLISKRYLIENNIIVDKFNDNILRFNYEYNYELDNPTEKIKDLIPELISELNKHIFSTRIYEGVKGYYVFTVDSLNIDKKIHVTISYTMSQKNIF